MTRGQHTSTAVPATGQGIRRPDAAQAGSARPPRGGGRGVGRLVDVLEAVRGHSTGRTLGFSLSLVALLGLADFRTGWELSFSIFYLVPIAIAAWGGGRTAGLIVAAASVGVGFGTDLLAGGVYSSDLVHVWNMAARLGVFVALAVTLVALRTALDQAREQANMDPLTGLPNARRFFEYLDRALGDARRSGAPVTVAFVDVDNFKEVNDTLGHRAGDDVLRRLSTEVRSALRASDRVGRVGGDEFAILLARTTMAGARHALARVVHAADAEILARGWPISLSIGAVTVEGGAATSEDLLHAADDLMYRVKRAGKGDLAMESFGATR